VNDSSLLKLIDEMREFALQIDRDIGFLSWELRPTELDELGLKDALRSFVREWSGQYGIRAEFHADMAETDSGVKPLTPYIEISLYRIVQEALNNVLKHAKARNVNVLLQRQDRHLILIIEDDGTGIKQKPNDAKKGRAGLGLVGMRERAALMNGTLQVESRQGKSTTILARIPISGD
jgi:two-component system, chemotaxis family, sensor kinase Cph1